MRVFRSRHLLWRQNAPQADAIGDQNRQIRVGKGYTRRWHTVMFDVGGGVIMMGKGGRQRGILRVRLRIVPAYFFFA